MAEGHQRTARLPPLLPSHRARALIAGAYLLIAGVLVADLLSGSASTFSPVLAAVPVLASTGTRRPGVPLFAGMLATVMVGVLWIANSGVPVVVHLTSAATVLAVTCTSTASVALVAARERELAQVRTVSEAAQQALLRPVPHRVGPLRIAVRYAAAAAEARIGGDLYDVVSTPYGVRLLLGDVRGKGLAAVDTAADVLGVFRDAARSEPDTAAVATRMDAALARREQGEEFVTAVLLTVPPGGGPAVLVNCGHPPPALLHPGRGMTLLHPPADAPPLGLLGLVTAGYAPLTLAFDPGDILLLYTDGVCEARDAAGRFYPLARRLERLPRDDPDILLETLLADVLLYGGGTMNDDAALLAVRRES